MLQNLDFLCAKTGRKIVENKGVKDKNVIQKALGVLQEDGLYAFTAYLKSKSSTDSPEKTLLTTIIEFLKRDELKLIQNNFEEEKELYGNLDKLILTKSIIEKILIYALYYAKAENSGG